VVLVVTWASTRTSADRPAFGGALAAAGATVALLWAAGWTPPFIAAVQGRTAPPLADAALVVAATAALVLAGVALAARRLVTATRLAVFIVAFAALIPMS